MCRVGVGLPCPWCARAERAHTQGVLGAVSALPLEPCFAGQTVGRWAGAGPAGTPQSPAGLPTGRAARRSPVPHSAVRRVQGGGVFRQSSRAPCTKFFVIGCFFGSGGAPCQASPRGWEASSRWGGAAWTLVVIWLQVCGLRVVAIWGCLGGARCLPVPRVLQGCESLCWVLGAV